jgi:hypothetical protein
MWFEKVGIRPVQLDLVIFHHIDILALHRLFVYLGALLPILVEHPTGHNDFLTPFLIGELQGIHATQHLLDEKLYQEPVMPSDFRSV